MSHEGDSASGGAWRAGSFLDFTPSPLYPLEPQSRLVINRNSLDFAVHSPPPVHSAKESIDDALAC